MQKASHSAQWEEPVPNIVRLSHQGPVQSRVGQYSSASVPSKR